MNAAELWAEIQNIKHLQEASGLDFSSIIAVLTMLWFQALLIFHE